MAELVWYVAYGSNMCAERFGCYLHGGATPGATRLNPGARDPSPPRGDRPVVLDRPVYVAGHSTVWGGGVAFLGHGPGQAFARAWLVTTEQLADVVAQENRRAPGEVADDIVEGLEVGEARLVTDGPYGTLVGLDGWDGIGACTFTSATDRHDLTVPSPAYARLLALGLVEAGHHDDVDTALAALEALWAIPGLDGP